jgi:hypothetical protein
MAADPLHLHRNSTGLTDAHKALIHLLAEICVEQYLAESEADNATEAPADERQEVGQ